MGDVLLCGACLDARNTYKKKRPLCRPLRTCEDDDNDWTWRYVV